MKKFIIVIFILSVFLTGCMPRQNPLDRLNDYQISNKITNQKLCKIVNSQRYQRSQKEIDEMQRRGLRDCSSAELFCISVGFDHNSPKYGSCAVEYNKWCSNGGRNCRYFKKHAVELAKKNINL